MERRDLLLLMSMLVSLFVSIGLPMVCALVLSGKTWKAAQDEAHSRRMAEHQLNARLLRFNI